MNNGHESNIEERIQRAERIAATLADIQDETHVALQFPVALAPGYR